MFIFRSWLLCTRLYRTTTCTWRALCWSPTWSRLDTPALRNTPPRMWPVLQWWLWGAASLLQCPVSVIWSAFLPHNESVYKGISRAYCCISVGFFQASASCLVVKVKRRPPSTWTPSTKCPSVAPGSWPSLTDEHYRPPLFQPGRANRPTRTLPRRLSATGPRWDLQILSFHYHQARTVFYVSLILVYSTFCYLVNHWSLKALSLAFRQSV